VISLPFAHVGGLPIEETLGSLGPAFLVGLGVTWTRLRARLRRGTWPGGSASARGRSGR
jgi:hypothetical protein